MTDPPADRRLYAALAATTLVAFVLASAVYWVPAHPGVDQNGYLVGGKMMAATGSTGFRPDNPFAFVGRMWVQTADGRCFPKYPLGLSAGYAAVLKLGGRWGVRLCFCVNPLAMAAGLVATFALIRRLAGSFAGWLGLLLVATSPVCAGLTDNPNSHATAFCCVAWGMLLLPLAASRTTAGSDADPPPPDPAPRSRKRRDLARAAAAGLLLGCAVTIRYTEGLLLLPIGLVALLDGRRAWPRTAVTVAAWAVPVAVLVVYNLHQMGTLTGYDPTNESTGFARANLAVNWETMARELAGTGLFFTLPFAVLGIIAAARDQPRTAVLLAAWAGPNLLLYSAYYWAPDDASISYLRFTLTVFPALAAAVVLGLRWVRTIEGPAATAAVGLVVAIGCGVGLWTSLDNAAADAAVDRSALASAAAIRAAAPVGSVVFGPDKVLNYLQLVGDYRLYDTQQFSRPFVQRMATVDPNAPTGLQPQRAAAIYAAHKDDTESDLLREQASLATAALAAGRRVFVVEPVTARIAARLSAGRRFVARVVGGWEEPPDLRPRRRPTVAARRPDPAAVQWQIVELKPPVPSALPSRRGRKRAA